MANGPDHLFPFVTQNRQRTYLFYSKHHKAGSNSEWRQWAKKLTDPEEFRVFDIGDFHQLDVTPGGGMYAVFPDANNNLRVIGEDGEQLAYFPQAADGSPWHGYPVNLAEDNDYKVPRALWKKMFGLQLLDKTKIGRINKGHHA